MRINKYIAQSGFCSRRKAEEFITNGDVTINGKVVTQLSFDVEEDMLVEVSGVTIKPILRSTYIMLNKPAGYVCTVKDPHAKKTIFDLIRTNKRLYPIGRLDKDSCGLLLVTDDGELTYRLTHPKHGIEKKYLVRLDRSPTYREIQELENGIELEQRKLNRCKIFLKSKKNHTYHVMISEGRNRQVRKMFKALGYNVLFLKRLSIGDLKLGSLKEGAYRHLTSSEIDYLKGV